MHEGHHNKVIKTAPKTLSLLYPTCKNRICCTWYGYKHNKYHYKAFNIALHSHFKKVITKDRQCYCESKQNWQETMWQKQKTGLLLKWWDQSLLHNIIF